MISFICISILGVAFFFFKKRKFDLFTLAYLSSLLYFSPGFFGHVSFVSNFVRYEEKILDKTYLVFDVVLLSIVLSSIFFDKIKLKIKTIRIDSKKDYFTGEVSLIISFISFGLLIYTVGSGLLNPNKLELISDLNVWMMLLNYSSSIAVLVLYQNKQWFFFFLAIIVQLIILIIGFRFPFVISLIGIVILNLSSLKPFRLIKYKKYFIYGIILVLFTLIIKRFLFAIKTWDTDLMISIANDHGYLLEAITSAEPFETQSILNKVLQQNFSVPLSHLDNFMALFIFESSRFNIDIRSFNSYFQSVLFPGVRFGMASNIWAQFYAIGSWLGLLLFVIFYNLILKILSSCIFVFKSKLFKSVFILMGVYWAFYIQRNDLAYIFATQKKLFLSGVIIFFISGIYKFLRKKRI